MYQNITLFVHSEERKIRRDEHRDEDVSSDDTSETSTPKNHKAGKKRNAVSKDEELLHTPKQQRLVNEEDGRGH